MSGWFNINEGLSSIKGQLTTFANNVLADDEGANSTEEDYKKLFYQKDLEIERLRQLNNELQKSIGTVPKENGEPNDNTWDWTPAELTAVAQEDDVSNLKETIKTLENDKNYLLSQLEQLDAENQQNLAELVRKREQLQDENNELKEENAELRRKVNPRADGGQLEEVTKELSVLKSTHETLQKTLEAFQKSSQLKVDELETNFKKSQAENKILLGELQKSKQYILEAEEKSKEDADNCQKLAAILESYEKEVNSLKENLKVSSKKIEDLQRQLDDAPQTTPTDSDDVILTQKKLEENHNKYISIIAANVKRHIEADTPSSEEVPIVEDDNPLVMQFSHQVENIFKILQEFKQKCYALEQDLLAAQNEKTQILNEKYEEIEKLIQNSELLSQEVMTKGETIKELEAEISHLITNNDVLMAEVDQYKNSGLQTISESNEDSMVLLETDLENANKRIKELENIIDSPCKSAALSPDSAKHEDYQELLSSFDDLKIDYDQASQKLQATAVKVQQVEAENEELKANVDRLKADFENTEYQLSEANFALDSLKEELEEVNADFKELQRENQDLKLQTMSMVDLKSELNDIREQWLNEQNLRRELEAQLKALTEKLQNSKVSETSLKLQLDTLCKERQAAADTKGNLEQALSNAKSSLQEYENNYTELLQKYDAVLLSCEELNTQLHGKDAGLLKLEEENERLKVEVGELTQQIQRCVKENDVRLKKVGEIEDETGEARLLRVKELEDDHERLRKSVEDNEVEDGKLLRLKELEDENERLKKRVEDKEAELNKLVAVTELKIEENPQTEVEKTKTLDDTIKKQQQEILIEKEAVERLQQQLQDLANFRNELINMVQIKHQESLSYHQEIQRLSALLTSATQKTAQLEAGLLQAAQAGDEIARKSEEIDRLKDENTFLKEKCDLLAKNLQEEQAKTSLPSEKEQNLLKQLERLQSHLMELEERYTQELLQTEKKNAELEAKVGELEMREKNSSTMYTSVSIRANQQVESLQSQLQAVVGQRDELRKKMSDMEDANGRQAAALANLQFVLEQFQKDKEKDVQQETERIRRQITVEKRVQDDLRKEIDNLKGQLDESKVGLQAASRLSDQLELVKKQNSGLKDEVMQLQQKLTKSEKTIQDLSSQTDGKIDKSLIKSLIVGFLSSGNTDHWNKDQVQVLKLIATVLDFNQQDHDKVKLNKPQHQSSWFGSLLFPQPTNQNMSQESLSQAFVRFLENESKPREVPSLLGGTSPSAGGSTESSKRTTPTASPSPIVLNEVVLPTFAEFGQSRSSSSILKDVLKDNSR